MKKWCQKMPVLDINYKTLDCHLRQLVDKDKSLVNEIQITNDGCVKQLKYATKDCVKQLICRSNGDNDNNGSIDVIDGNNDVIVNQYEGGFKIWEGLYDIINYFIDYKTLQHFSEYQNLNVLELGCGSGLASIYCSKKLPKANYYLQDFNEDVIKYFTAINVLLNSQNTNCELKSQFNHLCGDWSAIDTDIDKLGLKFDLIFTSETLYNCDNYEKLCKIFKTALSASGSVYIASKSHYFGCGGGSFSFMDFIDSHKYFNCQIIHEIDSPLIRHILKLSRK